MLLLRHILVATDFSPISIAPLRHALGIARRYHSRVTLLHVIDGSFFGITAPDAIAADTDCALRDGGELIAHLDKEGIAQGLKLDFTARVGPASETVLDVIGEKQADLLVLGTHGRSGLGKLVLGSVAQKAFREALCPVLTVGPKAAHSTSSGAEAMHFLVPTDLSGASMNAIQHGVSLAKATGGDLTLLHVLDPHTKRNVDTAKILAEVESQVDQFLNKHPGAAGRIRCRLEFGAPAQSIVKVAEQSHPDLIVMGLRAWSPDGQPPWRTAYDVVIQAPCPVVSMKTPLRTTTDSSGENSK